MAEESKSKAEIIAELRAALDEIEAKPEGLGETDLAQILVEAATTANPDINRKELAEDVADRSLGQLPEYSTIGKHQISDVAREDAGSFIVAYGYDKEIGENIILMVQRGDKGPHGEDRYGAIGGYTNLTRTEESDFVDERANEGEQPHEGAARKLRKELVTADGEPVLDIDPDRLHYVNNGHDYQTSQNESPTGWTGMSLRLTAEEVTRLKEYDKEISDREYGQEVLAQSGQQVANTVLVPVSKILKIDGESFTYPHEYEVVKHVARDIGLQPRQPELDIGDVKELDKAMVTNAASSPRFLVPVPEMDDSDSEVEYIGDRTGTDWVDDGTGEYKEVEFQYKDKGMEYGIVFQNPKDQSEQVVTSDGDGYLIIPSLNIENSEKLQTYIEDELGGIENIKGKEVRQIIARAEELQKEQGIETDIYNTGWKDFVSKKLATIEEDQQLGYGAHYKKGELLEAVYVTGQFKFSSSETKHRSDNDEGMVIIRDPESNNWRASQPEVFCDTYKLTNGEELQVDTLQKMIPTINVTDLGIAQAQATQEKAPENDVVGTGQFTSQERNKPAALKDSSQEPEDRGAKR